MEISLENSDHTLRLGMPIDEVKAEFADLNYDQSLDEELGRSYLIFWSDGFDLMFQNDQLSSVFIYMTPNPAQRPAFSGELDYLPNGFFAAPNAQSFVGLLKLQGFQPSERRYPHATDMLNASSRLRYQEGPTGLMVFFDDGDMIR